MASLTDGAAAKLIAARAGEFLLANRDRSEADLHETTDTSADRLIADLLSELRPEDAVLSEELGGSGDRSVAERVWIIDPLDGTREYGEAGRTDWAVHVALWERGRLTVGVVGLPARDQVFSTDDVVEVADRPIKRIAVSRSRPPAWAVTVAEQYGAELVGMGSAGVKAMAVVSGEVDAYLHDGGQYEWDSAAPVAVAQHYGLHTSRADGSPLVYNKSNPWSPDLVICPGGQAEALLAAIAAVRGVTEDNVLTKAES
ncbi:3'(2'),5'-bisphosphate nucleotidase CysQ [soil metagenome]